MSEQEIISLLSELYRASKKLRGKSLRQSLALINTIERKYKINQHAK